MIAGLEWVANQHDPQPCEDLLLQAAQWDGEVADAIRLKALRSAEHSITKATFGTLVAARGGACQLLFGDIQMILFAIMILGVIKSIYTNCKCVAFLSRFCQKTVKLLSTQIPLSPTSPSPSPKSPKSPKSPPRYNPRLKPRPTTPIPGSSMRYRKPNKEVQITPLPSFQSIPLSVKTISTPALCQV